MLKRLRFSVLSFFLAGFALAAQTSSLSLSAPAVSGSTATVNVNWASGGVSAAALQWTLSGFPSGFTVAAGAAASGAMKSVACGPAACLAYGLNATAVPDGVVAVITYTNPSTAPTLGISAPLGASPAGTAVTVVIPAGPCDVNRDGKVDVNDVAAAVSIANGTVQGSLDLTGDNKTDIFDVFRVILAVLGGGPSACKVGP